MGKHPRDRQPTMWVPTTELPTTASHPFYRRLNQLLRQHEFDDFVETMCAAFYVETMGRPGLPPGTYFRLLLIGYFEGIDSERGIAWRAADSLALRDFLGLNLHDAPPDHSTISRTRRLIEVETHRAVFTWVLQLVSTAGPVKGKSIGVDATTLEANAAMRSIVRRDTGEEYDAFLTRLAKASGIATPTRADLARLDRRRKKNGSNNEWTHPHDPDARIAKMKDGRTRLAHKAEHATDLETGTIVGVTVQGADQGDTTTIQRTLPEAAEQLEAVAAICECVKVIEELVATRAITVARPCTNWRRSGFAHTSASPIADSSRGPIKKPNGTRSMPIAAASGAVVGSDFFGDGANCSSDHARICTRRARSAAPMSADTRTH